MKKLISLLLAVMMILGMSVTSMAADLTADGWNGWRGDAVTVANPVSGDATDRGDVVKVNGTATLTPNVNAIANTPIVELTVDIYGTGTVALVNGADTAAATVTVAADTEGYNANAWNEVKLLAVTGLKTYKAYVNGTEVVSDGTVAKTTTPVKISFTGTDLYVDDITLKEYRKSGEYPASKLVNLYTPDFSAPKYTCEMEGAETGWGVGWANYKTIGDDTTGWNTNTKVRYQLDSEKFAEDTTKKNVIKLWKDSETTGTNGNYLQYARSDLSGNEVFSMDIYANEVVKGELQIGLRDQNYHWKNYKNGFTVLSLYNGELRLAGDKYILPNAYKAEQWYNLKIEVNKENQSADIYWDNKKVNAYPLSIGSYMSDGFTSLHSFSFQINHTLENCTFYIANFKVDKLAEGTITRTVFEENFDGEHSFTHINSDKNATDALDLESNFTQTTVSTGQTARSGVAKLGMTAFTGSDYSYVKEENTSETDTSVTQNTSIKDEMWISPELDLEGANEIIIEFDVYEAGVSRKGSTASDCLYVGLSEANATSKKTFAKIQGNGHTVNWDGNTASARDTGSYVGAWSTTKFQMAVEQTKYNSGGENIGVYRNNAYSKWIKQTLTKADLSALKHLMLSIDKATGGRFYLDNIKLTATIEYGDLDILNDYYTATEYYTNAITREELPEIEISSILFTGDVTYPVDGEVTSVTVKKNKGESLDGSKLYVAVYDGDVMTDCGIAAVSGGGYTATFSGVTTTRESVVKVYLLDGSTLTPLITVEPVTTIFVVGDSLVADYVGLGYENGQSGWGEIENLGAQLNMNGVQIKDYAIGGTSTVDYFDRLAGTDGARFEIPNNNFWEQVKPGDYILISTAINDSDYQNKKDRYADPYGSKDTAGSFQYNLMTKYIEPAIEAGATPILVTTGASQTSHNTMNNRFMDSSEFYHVQAIRALAEEVEGVEIIDLYALWTDELSKLGSITDTAQYYVDFEYKEKDKDGNWVLDNTAPFTHTNSAGAAKAAEFIGICLEQIDGIRNFVK